MEPLLHTSHIIWNLTPLEGDYCLLNPAIKKLNDLFIQYCPRNEKINITMKEENNLPLLTGKLPNGPVITARFTDESIPFLSYIETIKTIIDSFIKEIEYQYLVHPLMNDPKHRIEYEKIICYDDTDYEKEEFKFPVGEFNKSKMEIEKLLDKLNLLEIDGKYSVSVILNDNTRYDDYQSEIGSYLILDIKKEQSQYMNKIISTESINISNIYNLENDADLMDEMLSQLFKEGNEKIYGIESYKKIQEKINLNHNLQEVLIENNLLSKPKL